MTTLLRLMKLIPAARWDEALAPDRFTPREVIAHMADWEPIFQERIVGALNTPNFVIQPHDETERAATFQYARQDVPGSMAKFKAAREKTLEIVGTLTEEQLRIPVTHPELGSMQLVDLVHMLSGHDDYHLDQLSEYLEETAVGTW